MTTSLVFTGLMLPTVLFTMLYFPALKLSLVLVSPYPKANLRRRLCGAAIDGLLVASCWVAYWHAGAVPYAVAATLYVLLRDAVGGQSIGRFLVGQVVIQVESGERCRLAGSIKRNLFLMLPGVNVAAVFLEARTLVRDPQGQRLGDRLAHTQVVEGLGARDVVRALQNWWTAFLAALPAAAGRPDRSRPVPVRPAPRASLAWRTSRRFREGLRDRRRNGECVRVGDVRRDGDDDAPLGEGQEGGHHAAQRRAVVAGRARVSTSTRQRHGFQVPAETVARLLTGGQAL